MDKQFLTRWGEAEGLWDMRESNSAQAQQLAESLQQSELEHQQLHIANEKRLQLEAQTLRMLQDMEHQALSTVRQKEEEVQRLGTSLGRTAGPPQCSTEEAGLTGCNVEGRAPTVPEGHKRRITTPEKPRKIPQTPAEPRRAPQNPRRDPCRAL